MAVKAASEAYEQAGVGPQDVDVVELHDCFSTNELMTYEALVSRSCGCWRSGIPSSKVSGESRLWASHRSKVRFLVAV